MHIVHILHVMYYVVYFTYVLLYCILCIVSYILHISYVCAYVRSMTSCLPRVNVYVIAVCKRNDFLSDVGVELKTREKRRREMEKTASGVDIPQFFSLSLW